MRFTVPVGVILTITVAVAVMTVSGLGSRAAVFAAEGHVHEPEHIKGCDEGGDDSAEPVDPISIRTGVSLPENLVLRPEASERRNTGDGEGSNAHRDEGDRHIPAEPAHLVHVL